MHAKLKLLLLASVAFAGSAIAQTTQLVYEETFTFSGTGGSSAISTIGWDAYYGSDATRQTAIRIPEAGDLITSVYIANAVGNPNTPNGFLNVVSGGALGTLQTFALFDTNMGVSGLKVQDITRISWNMGNRSPSMEVRLMVQVGNAWYATSTAFANQTAYSTAAQFASNTTADVIRNMDFTTDASAWREVTFIAGTELSLGTSPLTEQLNGNITGIGFYVQTNGNGNAARLDTLQVYANIPEPATVSLLITGVIAGTAILTAASRCRSRKEVA